MTWIYQRDTVSKWKSTESVPNGQIYNSLNKKNRYNNTGL